MEKSDDAIQIPEFQALFLAVERADEDAMPLLATADWCDEHNLYNLAYALRWCAAKNKRPFKRAEIKRYPWQWIRQQDRYKNLSRNAAKVREKAILPHCVFDKMCKSGLAAEFWSSEYSQCFYAYEELEQAIKEIRTDIEYGDLPPTVHKPVDLKLIVCPKCGMARAENRKECPLCQREDVP